MLLTCEGHTFRYELENICRLFLPQEKITVTFAPPAGAAGGVTARTILRREGAGFTLRCEVSLEDYHEARDGTVPDEGPGTPDACELELAALLFELLAGLFDMQPDWGLVTGVRPVKLLRRLTRSDGEAAARAWFRDRLHVNEAKIDLCCETLRHEDRILALSRPESCSLYLSIPFCPTRCDYCSFVSHTVERAAKLIPPYVELLAQEIAATGALARDLGLRLETVYFGGGTPTTLSAEQLARLCDAVASAFDMTHVREYTVEAGRPDTVTADKLRVLRAAGVNRVSVNPQTLHDRVLEAIGRRHTADQFYTAYELTRACGFDNINTDLIAGLPGDDPDGFRESLDGIVALAPDSITVHTLSMKRASNLVIRRRADYRGGREAAQMVAYTAECLPPAGYRPYYLYRQSRMVGNQENVGWSRPGKEGLYNVYIMDETHTILACGAGAVTKLKQPEGDYIERIYNFKYPYEYNSRFAEMLGRKARIRAFYEQYGAAPMP